MTAVTLQYRIPLYDDKKYMGELKDCTVKDGYIILNYSATPEAKGYSEPAIVIQQVETEISFQWIWKPKPPKSDWGQNPSPHIYPNLYMTGNYKFLQVMTTLQYHNL